jgi:hypothetical protein
MTANKYLQKILEIHGLDIKTIGGRSNDSIIEDNSIGGGVFSMFKKTKVGPEPDVAPVAPVAPESPESPVSPVISNNVSCINDTYMDKVNKLLLKMKEDMKEKRLTEVVVLSNTTIFVGLLKPLKIKIKNKEVNNLQALFAQLMKLENNEVIIKPTVTEIVTILQPYFNNNCDHILVYIDNVITATLNNKLTVTKPNIKQLTNGINPSYGGGFILFDSEFKAQNIIHTNYSNTNDIVMHNLLISNYNDDSVNAFMTGNNTNDQKLNVSELVTIMKSAINM